MSGSAGAKKSKRKRDASEDDAVTVRTFTAELEKYIGVTLRLAASTNERNIAAKEFQEPVLRAREGTASIMAQLRAFLDYNLEQERKRARE